MARGGHNAKSTAELKKAGTFQKFRHENRLEVVAKPVDNIPDPPDNFNAEHREEWVRCCEYVFKLGLLTDPDVYLIEIFVRRWFMWQRAMDEIDKRGILIETKKGIIKNPAINVANESERIVNQIAALFGFSPKSRMGIKAEKKTSEQKASILNLIKGGKIKID